MLQSMEWKSWTQLVTEQQQHPGSSAPYYVAAWMRGALGEQGYMPTAESLCCPPETMTMLLSATLQCRRKSLQNQTKPVSSMLVTCQFHICNSACLLKRICGPQADAHVLSRHRGHVRSSLYFEMLFASLSQLSPKQETFCLLGSALTL